MKLNSPAVFCMICLAVIPSLPAQTTETGSLQDLTKSAGNGDAGAQWKLGAEYESGTDVKMDYAQALDWYQKAAAQNFGPAMASVGDLYAEGKGVEKNPEKAAQWYEKAIESNQQTFAEEKLLALSSAGLIKEKFAGIAVMGGLFVTKVDTTTPTADLVKSLSGHTELIETGKAYWIGYNDWMLSIAARGDTALPLLADFVKKAHSSEEKEAGLLTIHLIGIDSDVAGRFDENFKDRKARETLWGLMKVEGLTDNVANLLKRDPWPADVPSIMDALSAVKSDCAYTMNALKRYHLERMPIDTTAGIGLSANQVSFTVPVEYNDREFVALALNAIKSSVKDKLVVEKGVIERLTLDHKYGTNSPYEWTGNIGKLLDAMTDYEEPFDYEEEGRPVFYYGEGSDENETLHICTPATAKKRLLDWWRKTGKDWYVNSSQS
jgi:tetratricopeptide (TPR) repeat protein